MPIYDFECSCGNKDNDVYDSPAETERKCSVCRNRMRRLLPLIHISPDIEPYLDENLDSMPVYVGSRRQLRDELKKRRLVQIG